MTKFVLFSTLAQKGEAWITLPNGQYGILQSVQRENGGGSGFNVTITQYPPGCGYDGVTRTYYVRTID
jgi:hypothetical protein